MSKEEKQVFEMTLEGGRLINGDLFVKDKFNEESTPKYKVEMAWPEGHDEIDKLYNLCLEAIEAEFGEVDEDECVFPILDGNILKRKREKKDKDGDAYEDMEVIRAGTIFNKDGEDGPGGIDVFDENVEPIPMLEKGKVFNGSYGSVTVSVNVYTVEKTDSPAASLYLEAYQMTGGDPEKDRLSSPKDRAGAFKKVGKAKGGRKSRKG